MGSRRLDPFFSYYGAKHRASRLLQAPEHGRIVEAFAGSAGYASQHPGVAVTLVEVNPRLAAMWQYLTRVTPAEILSLPLVVEGTVDDLPICDEARDLIGFWLNRGASAPRKAPGLWMQSGIRPEAFWGDRARARIARQVDAIRHWEIRCMSYADFDGPPATTIVDPPYVAPAGRKYTHNRVDYGHLADWCRARPGVVYAHEQDGADWLPFQPWIRTRANNARGGKQVSHEALCVLRDGVVAGLPQMELNLRGAA